MDVITLALSKKYTDNSISGISGSLAGKNCVVNSITHDDTNKKNVVEFGWTADDGSSKTAQMDVPDGLTITSLSVDSNNHLIATLSDGSTIDSGKMPSTEVAISAESGNALTEKTDGLYVSTTGVEISKATDNAIETKADGLYVKKTSDVEISKATGNTIETKADGLFVPATEIATSISASPVDTKATSEKLVKTELDKKVNIAQGVANKDKVLKVGADGNLTLGEDKGNEVVTAWETTTVDTKVPSEKLVKDTIDGIDATKLNVDNTATTKQTIKANLDGKVDIKQKVADKGKSLVVGDDGNLALDTIKGLEIVDKTKAEYDALTEAEKKDATKLYNITDADDLDLTNYVKMPSISSSAILHTFATNESWTATEDCWLIGMIRYVNSTQGDNDSSIKVNSIFVQTAYCSSGNALTNVSMPISKGDVVSTSTYGTFNALKAYRCK